MFEQENINESVEDKFKISNDIDLIKFSEISFNYNRHNDFLYMFYLKICHFILIRYSSINRFP